jgi:hypothetical protein
MEAVMLRNHAEVAAAALARARTHVPHSLVECGPPAAAIHCQPARRMARVASEAYD